MVEKTVNLDRTPIWGGRNYQLDFIKFVLSLLVFLCHTETFIGEKTKFVMPTGLGWWCVHTFFIISGLMMINSAVKKDEVNNNFGKHAFDFVMNKFRGISVELFVGFFIGFVMYLIRRGGIKSFQDFQSVLVQRIPELMMVNQVGLDFPRINTVTWYVSAMLISMLILYYVLIRNRSFYIFVFAPLTAFLTYAWMFNQDKMFVEQWDFNGIIVNGLIRAVCGICFGSISWIISQKIKSIRFTKFGKNFLTATEILLYTFIIFIVLTPKQSGDNVFSVLLLVPIVIAISFSQQSYTVRLFKQNWMKHLASLSFSLYLVHNTAAFFIKVFYPDASYKRSVLYMLMLTLALMVVYYLLVYCFKKVLKGFAKAATYFGGN